MKTWIIFKKQVLDTFKNKTILLQILLFPIMALILTSSINDINLGANYFVCLFASMYVGMVPVVCVSAIIAEEKEKGTLKILQMCNVKAHQYLLGITLCIFSLTMIGTIAFALIGSYHGMQLITFSLWMAMGLLISCIIGGIIGIISKNQMMATSLSMPIMMVLAFIPMLSIFNQQIATVGKYVYTYQIYSVLNGVPISTTSIVVIVLSFIVVLLIFAYQYRRVGLNNH